MTAQVTGKQIILPIWHNVTRDDVFSYSPSLAGRVAALTADMSIPELAAEIAGVIRD